MSWQMKPQTETKHKLLREYLARWIPILAQRREGGGRVVYVDGFSGAGRYESGDPGSPLLAIEIALHHSRLPVLLQRPDFEMVFVFLEMDEATWQNLKAELKQFVAANPVPSKLRILEPIHGEFSKSMKETLDLLDEQRKSLAPAFVFVDPFGPVGFPFETIRRLMVNRSCEVFIRFNHSRLTTFISRPNMKSRIDELYGCDEWLQARELRGREREVFLIELYESQLKGPGGIRFVQPFRTVDLRGRIAYFVFATNSSRGFEEMKDAMWKVDPFGMFEWRARKKVPEEQLSFADRIAESECVSLLSSELLGRFTSSRQGVVNLEEFVRCQPVYLARHLRAALKELESADNILNVTRTSGMPRKRGTFPTDSVVEFGE